MSTINEVADILRIPINAIAEAQRKLKEIGSFNERKEYLAKEFTSFCLTQAEAAILGANDICTNIDNCDEFSLTAALNGVKTIVESINPPSQSIS